MTIWRSFTRHKRRTNDLHIIDGKILYFSTVESAIRYIGVNWIIERYPSDYHIICNSNFDVLWRSDRTYKQLSLFGE
jgi:hypothetical protein